MLEKNILVGISGNAVRQREAKALRKLRRIVVNDNGNVLVQGEDIPEINRELEKISEEEKEQFKKNLIHELGYIAYNNYKRTYNLSDEGNFLLESFPDIMTDEEYEVLKDSKIFKPLKEFEHAKISLVVTTKAAFNVLANSTQFTSLNLWMSVILIDYNSFSVIKEAYITTALPYDIPQQDTSIQFKEVSSKI